MGRKKKVNTGEYNRYFDSREPLQAPEAGYVIRPQGTLFSSPHQEGKFLAEESKECVFEGKAASQVRGKRQFAYPVMALMVTKEYGPVKEAMEEMIVVDADTEFDPFIVKEGEEYRCLGGPGGDNPFNSVQSKTYDPKKEEDIGQQLSAGKAAEKGDVFEWRTNMF